MLAIYFASEDQWVLAAGDRTGLALPAYAHREGPPPAADQIEAIKKEQKRLASVVVEIINGLITQFETQ